MTEPDTVVNSDPSAETLQATLAECCVELMADYGIVVEPASSGLSTPPLTRIAAAIDFSGEELGGTVVLWATHGVLVATNNAVAGTQPASDQELLQLNLELVNQLAGRLKNKLRRYGVSFRVALPRVVPVGVPADPNASQRRRFVCSLGSVSGSLDVAFAPGVVLAARHSDSQFPVEGDMIVF